ncbi:MAG: class I SAM-dependent methyltransferase [Chloroflexota bacterium]
MKFLDRWLRERRIAQARPFIPQGAVLLDIGCGDGSLVRDLGAHVSRAVGIDPELAEPERGDHYELRRGRFPDDLAPDRRFDVITMLAVLEHLPPEAQAHLAYEFAALLNPGGRVLITVPSPRVDHILHVLLRLRLIAGIRAHEHYGFKPEGTPKLFPSSLYRLVKRSRFQLGLNNLFVFERTGV